MSSLTLLWLSHTHLLANPSDSPYSNIQDINILINSTVTILDNPILSPTWMVTIFSEITFLFSSLPLLKVPMWSGYSLTLWANGLIFSHSPPTTVVTFLFLNFPGRLFIPCMHLGFVSELLEMQIPHFLSVCEVWFSIFISLRPQCLLGIPLPYLIQNFFVFRVGKREFLVFHSEKTCCYPCMWEYIQRLEIT